ncbi:MAG: MBL fold metallo-hydrolase [Candidatus Xenobia bacterium]
MANPDLYFRQIPAGPMANFVYAIGSQRTKECLLVDPAWDVERLLKLVEDDGYQLVGVLATHYHPDHIGGNMFGFEVESGITELLGRAAVPIHIQKPEAKWVKEVTGVADRDLVLHDSGDRLQIGDVSVQLIHTPGHTPGSQCFLVDDRLVSGDTLFLTSCGRLDLPGGDREAMFESLTQKLARVPDDVILYPGHAYDNPPNMLMREVKRINPLLSPNAWR